MTYGLKACSCHTLNLIDQNYGVFIYKLYLLIKCVNLPVILLINIRVQSIILIVKINTRDTNTVSTISTKKITVCNSMQGIKPPHDSHDKTVLLNISFLFNRVCLLCWSVFNTRGLWISGTLFKTSKDMKYT